MKAVIYVRISRDHAGEGLGVQRQEQDCRELAARLGWDVAFVYVDNDFSASQKKVRRPAYQQLLEDMRNRRFGAVIAWIPDRLYRQPVELEELITIADENHIEFATVKAGTIDLSTSSGRLVARILGAAAKHEIEIKSERQVAQKKQAAYAGKPNAGGARPYGWKEDRLTVEPEEAQVIVKAADMVLSGQSLLGIVEWFHDEAVPGPKGTMRWHPITVRRILTNPRLAGLATYKDEIVAKGMWEPILAEPTWRRVNERLRRFELTDVGTPRRAGGVSLFVSSTIRCGVCGFALLTSTRAATGGRTRKVRVYACREKYLAGWPGHRKSCGSVSVAAEFLEDDVAERIMARLLSPKNRSIIEAAATRAGDDGSKIVEEVADLEERLRLNAEDWSDRTINRSEFLAISSRLKERIAETRSRLKVVDAPRPPTDSASVLLRWWEDATLAEKRALVDAHILKVTVGRSQANKSKYDPERVNVDWR